LDDGRFSSRSAYTAKSYQETPGLKKSADQPQKSGETARKGGAKKKSEKEEKKELSLRRLNLQLKSEKKVEPSPFGVPGNQRKGAFLIQRAEKKKSRLRSMKPE